MNFRDVSRLFNQAEGREVQEEAKSDEARTDEEVNDMIGLDNEGLDEEEKEMGVQVEDFENQEEKNPSQDETLENFEFFENIWPLLFTGIKLS